MNDKQWRGSMPLSAPITSRDGTERAGITVTWPSHAFLAETLEVKLSPGYATVILKGRTSAEVVCLTVPISEQPNSNEG